MENLKDIAQDIHNIKPIAFGELYAYVPDNYDQDLKDDILSVFAKRILRLKSIDYVKERYIENIPIETRYQDSNSSYNKLLKNITKKIWSEVIELYGSFQAINFQNETNASLAVESTLSRLITSYECTLFLIKNRFFFESVSICRQIFEQLTYCINVCDLTQDEFANLSKTQTKKTLKSTDINKIKKLLHDIDIKYFYSLLSDVAHIGINQVNKYLYYNKDLNSYIVRLKSIKLSIESALILLKIVDIHSIVFEYSLRNHITSKFKCCNYKNGEFKINSNRQIKFRLLDFQKQYNMIQDEEI